MSKPMLTVKNLTKHFPVTRGIVFMRQVAIVGLDPQFMDRYAHQFSGGQQSRISIAKLLLTKHNILLLDEPTNHLDIEAVKWLEGYLKSYDGTIVLISHDRYFLDQVVNKVYEINNHKLLWFRKSEKL